MPTCKNCGNRIEKFHTDRCPICGQVKPFEGFDSNATVEITTSVDVNNLDYKPRNKKTLLVLAILLGYFGAPFFYLKNKVGGIIQLCANMVAIASITLIMFLAVSLPIYVALIIAFGALLVVNTIIGLNLFLKKNLQDYRGDFVV